ncbi:MAG: hypothetical protein Athens101428_327 [Candidatus Berkelbacteria bacterium Athens1014_28]|uniref:Uncharacterized protein n=1 Tax=Candidatus Berkelbacteria bacterium Athens1014_28 TaxID=2017145 RepID=A0A554LN86_9BACT|nr:MAG: hypothetical protein Athens101428_327 [Candidatus Berkelbacteria bacterium Athens1014_28]
MDKNIISLSEELDQVLKFQSKVFISSNSEEQKVLNLLLGFAIFFNDLKDLELFKQMVLDYQPEIYKRSKSGHLDPVVGQASGINIFIEKLYLAFLNEFIDLIVKNRGLLDSILFKSILSLLSAKEKKLWQRLINKIINNDKIIKTLIELRSNTAFHYNQPKSISISNKLLYDKLRQTPYISIGNAPSQTRYFFADLAVQITRAKIIKRCGFSSAEEWKNSIDGLVSECYSIVINILFRYICSKSAPVVPDSSDKYPDYEIIFKSL